MFARNKNLFIGIAVVLVVILLIIFTGGRKEAQDEMNLDETSEVSENSDTEENNEVSSVAPISIPMPAQSEWGSYDLDGKISFDVPEEYVVSRPNIGDCSVASISTLVNGQSVGVAFVYEADCDLPEAVTENYQLQEEVDGFIFQTLYTEPSVVEVFNEIVDSVGEEATDDEVSIETNEEESSDEVVDSEATDEPTEETEEQA